MDESPAIDRQPESDQSKEILDRLCINSIRTLSIDAIQEPIERVAVNIRSLFVALEA